jgi:hypothetical protein
MPTRIPYRQYDGEAVTMDTTGSTVAATRARSELAAMEGIADLLARLPDAAARHRVLQWAAAIVHQDEPAPVSIPGSMPGATPLHVVRSAAVQESKVNAQEDWGLSVGDLHNWFEKDSTPPPDDRLQDAVAPRPVASMIHGFVEDFRKLARDWQGD